MMNGSERHVYSIRWRWIKSNNQSFSGYVEYVELNKREDSVGSCKKDKSEDVCDGSERTSLYG